MGGSWAVFDIEKLSDEHHLYASLIDTVVREIPDAKSASLRRQFEASENRTFANEKTKHVEIYRNSKLEVLSFRPPEACADFPPEFLTRVQHDIQQFEDTAEATLEVMLQGMKEVAFDCQVKAIAASSVRTDFLMRNEFSMEVFLMTISALINLHVLLYFNTVHDDLDQEPRWANPARFPGRDGSSASLFVNWTDPQGGTVVYHIMEGSLETLFDGSEFHGSIHMWLALLHLVVVVIKGFSFFVLVAPLSAFRIHNELAPEHRNIVQPSGISTETWYLLAYSGQFWFTVLTWVCSAGGLLISPAFYGFFLLDLFTHSKTIQLVVTATKAALSKMLWLLGLMLMIIYWYASVAHMLFWNQQADYRRTCSTLFQCFASYTNEGLKNAGISGLVRDITGTDTYPRSLWDKGDILANVVVDLSFFLIIIFVLASFLNGVIVDTFGELRDANDADAARLAGECFVCGLTEDDFKKGPYDLDEHRQVDHSLINYVFLVLCIQEKNDRLDLIVPGPRLWTAQELYVRECIENGDISFLPQGQTLCLQKVAEEEEDGTDRLEAELAEVKAKQSTIESKLDDVMAMVQTIMPQGTPNPRPIFSPTAAPPALQPLG